MLPRNVIQIDEYRRKRAQAKAGAAVTTSSSNPQEARLKRIYEKIAKIQSLMLEIKKSTFLKK